MPFPCVKDQLGQIKVTTFRVNIRKACLLSHIHTQYCIGLIIWCILQANSVKQVEIYLKEGMPIFLLILS